MKLKICGINDIDILEHACEAGLDFVGFIMVNESPRNISNNFLASLERFNFLSTTPVFVFVNPSVDEVKKITSNFENAILQFHGDEEDSFCRQFDQLFWKTIRVKDSQSLEAINDFPSADAILLETFSQDAYGGTGKVFDWGLLEKISVQRKFVLAGGINPKNIKEAVSVDPWCIDVNSGVESSVALKDKALMDEIIKNINNG
ncbi:phosphoribosylanthranilate isomerase [Gammaproteobacteria bacterium]|jgi:phosphoribosylanthranilate isomerase|nr:phosphoribosylanthranilate isomerase [Gammaproteobacteria bacterium]|tara:strand:- start:7927 stop:8535 length:609 start_codon:yes stop_codon:yes gene_type:complete